MKVTQVMNFSKMTALITGAAGGVGKAFAVECASRGWDLFLTDARGDPLEVLAEGLRHAYGVAVESCACDLTDPAAREALFARIAASGHTLTILINVAGLDYEGPFYEQSAQNIQTILRVNIEATLAVMHAALRYRDPWETFHIINVASLAAFYPMPVKATYAASKRFLLDFSLALREELRNQNASVTILCPAGMPTTMECIHAIEAQGLAGHLTTVDVGRVADLTLNAALRGKAVVIPGAANRILQVLGSLVPAPLLAGLIGSRWSAVRERRAGDGTLPGKEPCRQAAEGLLQQTNI
jgi:short-subunit dehydrogenase